MPTPLLRLSPLSNRERGIVAQAAGTVASAPGRIRSAPIRPCPAQFIAGHQIFLNDLESPVMGDGLGHSFPDGEPHLPAQARKSRRRWRSGAAGRHSQRHSTAVAGSSQNLPFHFCSSGGNPPPAWLSPRVLRTSKRFLKPYRLHRRIGVSSTSALSFQTGLATPPLILLAAGWRRPCSARFLRLCETRRTPAQPPYFIAFPRSGVIGSIVPSLRLIVTDLLPSGGIGFPDALASRSATNYARITSVSYSMTNSSPPYRQP